MKTPKFNLKLTGFSFKRVARVLFYLAIIATMALIWTIPWIAKVAFEELMSFEDEAGDYAMTDELTDACNVQGIELHGELTTYIPPENYDAEGNLLIDQSASQDIVYYINQAEQDDAIKAIVLEVDSYGGWPVAAEEVANALRRAQKPTVALIREGGLSAAYWAATGADTIFASKNSDVGSIGVTMSYLSYTRQNQEQGIEYVLLNSGKFKDTGDPNKPLTAEERTLMQRDIDIIYENFVQTVAQNRGLEVKTVRNLADGSSVLGEMALEKGLIDQIGSIPEVEKYLEEKIGGKVQFCW